MIGLSDDVDVADTDVVIVSLCVGAVVVQLRYEYFFSLITNCVVYVFAFDYIITIYVFRLFLFFLIVA